MFVNSDFMVWSGADGSKPYRHYRSYGLYSASKQESRKSARSGQSLTAAVPHKETIPSGTCKTNTNTHTHTYDNEDWASVLSNMTVAIKLKLLNYP